MSSSKKRFATHVTAPDGKRVYLSATSKAELEKKVLAAKLEIGAGVNIGDDTGFEEYARLWAETYKKGKIRPNSYATLIGDMERHVIPAFQGMRVRDVLPMHVQQFLSGISGLSRSSQSKCFNIARAIFSSAVSNRMISRSPFNAEDKPGGQTAKEKDPLTDGQARQLLLATEGTRAHLFCLLALSLGLRRGEALGLMWEDFSPDFSQLRVQHSKTFIPGQNDAPVTTLLKSDSASRELPVPRVLREELIAAQAASRSPYVLSMKDGRSLSKGSWQSLWNVVTVRTESPGRPVGSRVVGSNTGAQVSLGFKCTPHLLRHTYITQLFEAGLDLKEIQYLAGHSTPDMTLKVYTHYRRKQRAESTADKVMGALEYLNK